MNGLLGDCRHALRLHARTLGASLIAVVVLALGMAFIGTFLSLYVDLILRPHPGFEQSGRIATVGANDGGYLWGLPYGIVERIAAEMTSIAAAGLSSPNTALVGAEREERLIELVSGGLFNTLRPRLALGRGFRPEDHDLNAEPVTVVSYRYWQEQLGGDRDVLGTTVEIARDPRLAYMGPPGQPWTTPEQDSAQFRIVGVMAEMVPALVSFRAGGGSPTTAVWIPLERAMPLLRSAIENLPGLTGTTFVRLRSGIRVAAFESEFRTRYDAELNLRAGATLDAIEGIVGNFTVQRNAKRQLEMFLAGSVLLALVSAANISLFLLARAPRRHCELGIRLAVGARIRRLVRQLATEAGLLAVVAATLGLFLSVWLSSYVRSLEFLHEAEWRDVTLLDWRVLSLAAALLLVLTLLVSLAPIVELKRLGIAASSRQVMARASLAQRLAGTAQIAVAGTLGGAAIAFAWYVGGLTFGDPGYETEDLYMVEGIRLLDSIQAVRQREAIEAIPGVMAVGYGKPVPGGWPAEAARIYDPRTSSDEIVYYRGVLDPAFIDVLGLDLVHGRAPEANENGVVVNQTLARMAWGRDDVVGEGLTLKNGYREESLQVIGVLRDMSFEHPSVVKPYVFRSIDNSPSPVAVIQAELTAAELSQALDRLVAAGELEAWATDVRPLTVLYQDLIAADRARSFLTITAAILVVLLAAFGFYGTQRYLVAAGRREYAIRLALGAGPKAIGRLVIRRSARLALPGLVAGGLLAFIVVSWLRDEFLTRGVSPAVVSVWLVAGLSLVLLAASLGPAQEARRTQPAPLLRED